MTAAQKVTAEARSSLRASWLSLEGPAIEEVHGWLIGVMCAVERKRGRNYRETDTLIAELRESVGPSWEETI